MPPALSYRLAPGAALSAALACSLAIPAIADDPPSPGERTYRERCASCHGESGQGVEGGYSRPLAGQKSVEQLTRYIEKSMPEDDPGTCVGEDARQVARYIFDAFYSPIAQARNRPARIDLARMTVPQYRNAVADLIGGLRPPFRPGEKNGLRGEYFNSGRPGNRRVLERTDARVAFDFGSSPPAPDLDSLGFSARWEGSLLAPETGVYELLVRTDHATRLWLNDLGRPLIDAWVKSGSGTEHRASAFLLGGRAYPIKLEFTSRKQGVDDKKKGEGKPAPAFIDLQWKLPKRVAEVIPSRHLSPDRGPEVFVVETPFPPDDRSVGYERGTSVSRAWVDATTEAAIEAAAHVTSRLEDLTGVRRSDDGREEKVRAFCGRLVERAFRQSLSDDERRLEIDRRFNRAPDLETAVKRVVLFALNSPRFLYLDLESGTDDARATASRLSFALWDSLPDEELLEAAAVGKLVSRDDVLRQAERMVRDPRARFKLSQFFHHWLHVDDASHIVKDEKRFAGFNEELVSDLRASLDLFVDDVIWGNRGDFRDLLLSNDLYLNGRLAAYYGFDLPAGAPFQKVDAGGRPRAGVLSHPYVMANLAYTDSSSPIHRGVFLIRSLLGRPLRPPPEAFSPLAPDLHPDLTTRERVVLQTAPEACQSCHARINPLGFTLEGFDAAGRYREEEKGKPIDASGSYDLTSGERKTFRGARELAEFLAGSEETHRAFVVHLFHHVVKQPVAAHGPETLARLLEVFTASQFNVRTLLVEIAATSALAAPPAGSALESSTHPGYDAARGKLAGERSF